MATATIAHEAIDLLALELETRGLGGPWLVNQRRAAADLAVRRLPAVTHKARSLILLLDQAEPEEVDQRIEAEVQRALPRMRQLLDAQRLIANTLKTELLVRL